MCSKNFRKDNHFVLYDKNDNIVCYLENFKELSNYLNYSCSQLVYQFNKLGNCINVIIDNVFYKLYTFVD